MALPTDYTRNKYIAIIFKRDSSYIRDPSSLLMTSVARSGGMEYVGQVGQLQEAHLYSMPLANWESFDINVLRTVDGISSADVQEPRMRAKRGADEF
ncbi:hypothetical protein CPB86DRAFT_407933 [Serendipita vermifera]|nr:hypothetical protein CPB86DRAFT_407933 [Serendipita vermifera]